jgi:hypothetical protein
MSSLLRKLCILVNFPKEPASVRCLPNAAGEWRDVTDEEDLARTSSYAQRLPGLIDEYAKQKRIYQSSEGSDSYEQPCVKARLEITNMKGNACVRTIRINNDSVVITAAIMTQLRLEIWLSDDIVNFCFMLMSIKEASTGKKRKTHFVTSSLYAQLFDDGGIYDFKKSKVGLPKKD